MQRNEGLNCDIIGVLMLFLSSSIDEYSNLYDDFMKSLLAYADRNNIAPELISQIHEYSEKQLPVDIRSKHVIGKMLADAVMNKELQDHNKNVASILEVLEEFSVDRPKQTQPESVQELPATEHGPETNSDDSQEMNNEENSRRKGGQKRKAEKISEDEDNMSDYSVVSAPSKVKRKIQITNTTASLFRPFKFESDTHHIIVYRYPSWTKFEAPIINMEEKIFVIKVTIDNITNALISDRLGAVFKNLKESTNHEESFEIKERIDESVNTTSIKFTHFDLNGARVFAISFLKNIHSPWFAPTMGDPSDFLDDLQKSNSQNDKQNSE